jgi:hypothetical protein
MLPLAPKPVPVYRFVRYMLGAGFLQEPTLIGATMFTRKSADGPRFDRPDVAQAMQGIRGAIYCNYLRLRANGAAIA